MKNKQMITMCGLGPDQCAEIDEGDSRTQNQHKRHREQRSYGP